MSFLDPLVRGFVEPIGLAFWLFVTFKLTSKSISYRARKWAAKKVLG